MVPISLSDSVIQPNAGVVPLCCTVATQSRGVYLARSIVARWSSHRIVSTLEDSHHHQHLPRSQPYRLGNSVRERRRRRRRWRVVSNRIENCQSTTHHRFAASPGLPLLAHLPIATMKMREPPALLMTLLTCRLQRSNRRT